MKYYSTWQEALIDFIKHYGQEYEDGYNLLMEFEERVKQNTVGTWFIYFPNKIGAI